MNEVYRICFILVALSKVFCEPSVPNCVRMEIVDNPSKDNIIQVDENLDVNFTFRVDTKTCTDATQQWLLKLSTFEKEKGIDKCKIPFINGTCQTKALEEPCSCLNSDMLLVQICEDFHESYYKIYSWTATSNASTDIKPLKRNFVVVKSKTKGEQMKTFNETNKTREELQFSCECSSSIHTLLVIVLGACVVVGGPISVICIVKLRRKTRGKSSQWSQLSDLGEYELYRYCIFLIVSKKQWDLQSDIIKRNKEA